MTSIHALAISTMLFAGCSASLAAPAQEAERADSLGALVLKYFPDAVVAQDNDHFTAIQNTILFTVRRHHNSEPTAG